MQDIGLFPSETDPDLWTYEPVQNAIWQTFGGYVTIKGERTNLRGGFAGRAPTFAGFVRRRELRERTRTVLAAFGVDIDIDVDRPVDRLPMGARQIVEIAKALSLDARILLLDEPTSALTATEAGALFETIRRLKGRGIGVVYVSHHMPEVFRIADWITVLRDGRRVMTEATSATSIDAVVEAMVGRTPRAFSASPARSTRHRCDRKPRPYRPRATLWRDRWSCRPRRGAAHRIYAATRRFRADLGGNDRDSGAAGTSPEPSRCDGRRHRLHPG